MTTIEERIKASKEKAERLERQRRVEKKKERETRRKKEQRLYYIIGELVSKYFPDVLRYEPGTKAENAITFQPLESFLAVLATDSKLVQELSEKASFRTETLTEKTEENH